MQVLLKPSEMSAPVRREKEKPQQIQVFVRTRPLNAQEKDSRQTSSIDIIGNKELSVKQQHGRKYAFDKVFAPHVSQLDIYMNVVHPLISEVLAGYNCTVFAYGQTGSGKTHTMVGGLSSSSFASWQKEDAAGIVPRAMAHLFEELHLSNQEVGLNTVLVSYVELYNEELYDLLADGDDTTRIRLFEDQNQKGSVIIQGIQQVTVTNNEKVKEILNKGQEKRRTAATLMNTQSSRSHTVFTITVHTRETTVEGDVLVKTGKLNLVDLAGSENISKSGSVDRRAREAGSINQSLLTLGRVIKSLVDRSGHIPYRESKLTRILQDSLGGRTKTSIIATISPALCNLEETLSTLEYANRARNITNRPEVNQRMSQKAVIAHYLDEIEKLRKDLHAARNGTGVFIDQENYEQLIANVENDKSELNLKTLHVRDLEVKLKEVEAQRNEFNLNWIKITESFEETAEELNKCRDKLIQTENEKNQQEFLANRFEEKAGKLYGEVQNLLATVKLSKNVDAVLREKIEKIYSSAKENCVAANQMNKAVKKKFEIMTQNLNNYEETCKANNAEVSTVLTDIQNRQSKCFDDTVLFMDGILQWWHEAVNKRKAFSKFTQEEFDSWMQKCVTSCLSQVAELSTQRKGEREMLKNLQIVMKNFNTDHQQNFNKLKTQLENSHQTSVGLCRSFEQDFKDNTHDLLVDVSELQVSTKNLIDRRDLEKQIALGQEAIKNIKNSISFLTDNYTAMQCACDFSKKEGDSILSTANKLEVGVNNLQYFGNTQIAEIIKNSEESVSLLSKTIDRTESSQVVNNNRQTQLLEECDQNHVQVEVIEEAVVKNLNVQTDEFMVKTKSVHSEDSDQLVNLENDLLDSVRQHTSLIRCSASDLRLNYDRAGVCIQNFAETTSQFDNQLSNDLLECKDVVTNFIDVKYRDIKPSGDTPVKSQLYCPELNPPTPRAVILGRFQPRLLAMETIEEPDNKENEVVN